MSWKGVAEECSPAKAFGGCHSGRRPCQSTRPGSGCVRANVDPGAVTWFLKDNRMNISSGYRTLRQCFEELQGVYDI
jgi:hypothetical protein